MTIDIDEAQLGRVRDQLMDQARLFEDPLAYVAGVEDTLDALRRLSDDERTIVIGDRPAARML